jgi:hypothetical protein
MGLLQPHPRIQLISLLPTNQSMSSVANTHRGMEITNIGEISRAMGIAARITHGQSPEARSAAFDMFRSGFSPKAMLHMATAYSSELDDYVWGLITGKVSACVDAKMARDKDLREADDEKSSDNPVESSDNPVESSDDPFSKFLKLKKGWGDYSDDDEPEPIKDEPKPIKDEPKPIKDPNPWTVVRGPFPELQIPPSAKAYRSVLSGHTSKTAQVKHPKFKKRAAGKNWSELKAKTRTSELYMWVFNEKEKKDPEEEKNDWFLWKKSPKGLPIDWRKDDEGWYTSGAKSLFQHRLIDPGVWIHRTNTEDRTITSRTDYVAKMRAFFGLD